MKIFILSIVALIVLALPSAQVDECFNKTGPVYLHDEISTASYDELKEDSSCVDIVSSRMQINHGFIDKLITKSTSNHCLLLFSSSDEFGESFFLSAFNGAKWSECELSRNSLDTLESFEPFATAFDGGKRFHSPTVYQALSLWDGQAAIEGGAGMLGSTEIYAIKLNLDSAEVLGCTSFWEWME